VLVELEVEVVWLVLVDEEVVVDEVEVDKLVLVD
jgi:hypothetical protein